MRSRTALASLSLLVSAPGLGCRGEFVFELGEETSAGDGDGDGTGEGDGDGDDPDIGPNLLANPSFEVWNGDLPEVWASGEASFERSEDASDGQASAIISANGYANVGQSLSFPGGLPQGTCVRGGMTIRYISGDSTPPAYQFFAFFDEGAELLGSEVMWVPNGDWVEVETPQLILPQTTFSIVLGLGDTSPAPHSYGIDDVWFRIETCE